MPRWYIEFNIDLAGHFLEGFTYETFCEDLKTFYAVMRALEIISEASRRLPNELKARHPRVPWQAIADAGNFYRHNYERVIEQAVWKTAMTELPVIMAAVRAELDR